MSLNAGPSRLFVYGSLLEAGERRRLLGREVASVPARLDGYQRGRRRYYFVATLERACVDGAILEGLSARDFEILDDYEDVPRLYTRQTVIVEESAGASLECWIYLPTGWERES